MFDRNDKQYLLRAIGQNNVVLFLGAGFSRDAKNRSGNQMPAGPELGKLMWDFMKYSEPFPRDTPLVEIYEAILRKGIPEQDIKYFLERHLLTAEIPTLYDAIVRPFWYRIYTTNVDDLVEKVYTRTKTGVRLNIDAFPSEELTERDQFLDKINLVYLNGRLPCDPHDITFSFGQYARRATPHDYLYASFVRDYGTKPTIFVGTELNEPLFWKYIEERGARSKSTPGEYRPKSFLIAPTISPTKLDILPSFNIIPVKANASEFLSWLTDNIGKFPSKEDILQARLPGLVKLIKSTDANERQTKDLKSFSQVFHHVPLELTAKHERSLYLLGASPRWEDIINELDAPRDIEPKLQAELETFIQRNGRLGVFAILGSAGSGKSTVLRRIGHSLAKAGRPVYLTNSEELPTDQVIGRALDTINQRVVLLFDNAEVVIPRLGTLLRKLGSLEKPPVIIIASRTNDFDRLVARLDGREWIEEHHLSSLSRQEIKGVIKVLERSRLLGKLTGMNDIQRIAEFETRSQRQILVAMREATSGRGFDEILDDEYRSLPNRETRVLYLCVALATEAGFRITRQEFIGCSDVTSGDALSILERNLKDIVIPTGISEDMLLLRHRFIAEYMVNQSAPRDALKEAYLRLLSVLATLIKGNKQRTRPFSLYRTLIRHHAIYRRFENNMTEARAIYDALAPLFPNDVQFLLQYGSLELEAGNLEFAENYLNQAESLDSSNIYVINAKGHLLLRKGVFARNKAEALRFRDDGSEILLDTISNPEIDDAFCYHIYCDQRLEWIHRWSQSKDETKAELSKLKTTIDKAAALYANDRRITELRDVITRQYLKLAT